MASKRQLGKDANLSSLHAKEPKLELEHTENSQKGDIFSACESGNLELLENLLKHGLSDPNQTDISKNTPLHHACQNGHLEIVKRLLQNEATQPDLSNENNFTPLHLACQNGHGKIVDEILKHEVNVNALTKDEKTPYQLSLEYIQLSRECVHESTLIQLYNKGAIINTRNDGQVLSLRSQNGRRLAVATNPSVTREIDNNLLRILKNDYFVVHFYVMQCIYDSRSVVISPDVFGMKAFRKIWYDCKTVEETNQLIKFMEAVNWNGLRFEEMLIISCVIYHHDDLLDKMIQNGANLNFNRGFTFENSPLHLACVHGKMSTVKLLANSGAKLISLNVDNETPISFAISKGRLEVVHELLKYSEEQMNLRNNDGMNPFEMSLSTSDKVCFKGLLLHIHEK